MTIPKASTSELVEIIKVAEKSYRNYITTIEDSKEFLKQLYDGLSSSYDDLSRETNVNIELMDKILASAPQLLDQLEFPDLMASLKSCFSSPPHLFMEEKMKAKRKQFAEAQKVLEIFLKGRCEDILKVRSVLQSITSSSQPDVNKTSRQPMNITSSPAPEVKESSQPTPPVTIKTELTINDKLKPKYGPVEVQSKALRYSAVIITNVIHPGHLYVQVVDEDVPLYHQMQIDLQQEFSSATKQSASYCPSKTFGRVYALKLEGIWYRVLVENHLAFYVDIGLREVVQPEMDFHVLPSRFLQLKAQAVKCALFGVVPKLKDGICRYPKGIDSTLRKYVGAQAVAIFMELKAGSVGSSHYLKASPKGIKELCALVTLYVNGASESVNTEVCRTDVARVMGNLKLELPAHPEMRRRALLQAEKWMVPETFTTISKDDEVDEDGPSDAVVTRDFVRFEAEDTSMLSIIPSSTAVSVKDDMKLVKFKEDGEDLDVSSVTFLGARSPEDLFFRTPELTARFIKIQNALYTHFDGQDGESVVDGSISCDVGFICAVQSEGRWYRAEVVDVESHTDVLVSLLDKDLSIMIHAGQIHRLPEELTDIPRTMLHCFLSGVYPASGSTGWTQKVTQHIIRRLKGAEQISIGCRKKPDGDEANSTLPVTVYVRECDPLAEITGLTSLNEELISLGLATGSWEPLGQPYT